MVDSPKIILKRPLLRCSVWATNADRVRFTHPSSATLKLYHMLARPAQLPEGICQRWLYLTGQANLQVGVSPQGYLVKCKNVYSKKNWNLTKNITLTHHSTMNKYAIWISLSLSRLLRDLIIPCLQHAKISCHAVNTPNPTCLGARGEVHQWTTQEWIYHLGIRGFNSNERDVFLQVPLGSWSPSPDAVKPTPHGHFSFACHSDPQHRSVGEEELQGQLRWERWIRHDQIFAFGKDRWISPGQLVKAHLELVPSVKWQENVFSSSVQLENRSGELMQPWNSCCARIAFGFCMKTMPLALDTEGLVSW